MVDHRRKGMARNVLMSPLYLVGGDSSQATVTGPWIFVEGLDAITFITKSTSANGTVSFEGSNSGNDPRNGPLSTDTVVACPVATGHANPAGSAFVGIDAYTPSQMPGTRYMRWKFAKTSGGAAADMFVSAEGHGEN